MLAGRAGTSMTPMRGRDVATSYEAWLDALSRAGGLRPPATETIDLAHAAGRVTAVEVVARGSSPSFDAAAMDGIAAAAATTTGAPVTLPAGAFCPVDTGDPLPPGTDTVIRREDVVLTTEAIVEQEAVPFANVRQVGEDVAAGDLLFRAGRCLRPADLAVLASVGETAVAVRRRPVVAIVPSGDELVPVGSDPRPGEIVETNSLMLAAMVEEAGGAAVRLPIVPDDPEQLTAALEAAVAEADLALFVAGSARGTDDHAVGVIERVGQVVVRGVAVRPGHPVVLGLLGSTPVIGVPGYPVSAALAFELFGVPLLAALGGRPVAERARARATATVEIRSTPASEEWIRVRVGRVGSSLVAMPLRRGAGVLSSLARADGLACVPLGSSGAAEGEEIEVELLRPLHAIEASLLVTGSTDPLLDDLAARCDLLADPDGSGRGATSLIAGHCHLALLATEDVPAGAVTLGAWERRLGLMVGPGDPLAIGSAEGLCRTTITIANRQPGSSSRRLLDALLAERSIDPEAVPGYAREARSHAAAAAAVAAGIVDCAVGASSAAARHALDFIPLETQTLALVAPGDQENDDRLARLRLVIGSVEWRRAIEALGYRSLPS